MDTKLLVDAIVRQTTVLIAQLSTAAGVRAPLAHVADQVFLDLAREIEAQGVGRKVVADMFGLSLRSYQKKMRRLTESASVRDRSLWEAVVDFVRKEGSVTRKRIEERFRHDGNLAVAAVLNDQVNSGLLYATGKGDHSVYGLTSEDDRNSLINQHSLDTISSVVWMQVYFEPVTREALEEQLAFEDDIVKRAVDLLLGDGRLSKDEDGTLRASRFVVPLGAAKGWETAVFDHFRAVATAIASKVRGSRKSRLGDVVGGSTLSFDLHPDHPHKDEVLRLLEDVRGKIMPLWDKVSAHNEANPVDENQRTKVYFYCGQYMEDATEVSDSEPAPALLSPHGEQE